MQDFFTESPMCSTMIHSTPKKLFSGNFMDETRPEPLGMEDPTLEEQESNVSFHHTVKSAISSRVAAMLDLSYSSSPCVAMTMANDYHSYRDLSCCSDCESFQPSPKSTRTTHRSTQAESNDLQKVQGQVHSTKKVKGIPKDKRRSLAKKLKRVGQMLYFRGDKETLKTLAIF